jgi:hypothetical protein
VRNYLAEAHYVLDAYFVYAAFTGEGYIKVGISRIPFERIAAVHSNSPFPVEAAIWSWIGSKYLARRIEKQLKALWADRNTRGEWYRFDYADEADKRLFFGTINAVVEAVVGERPTWQKKSGADVRVMVQAAIKKSSAKTRSAR